MLSDQYEMSRDDRGPWLQAGPQISLSWHKTSSWVSLTAEAHTKSPEPPAWRWVPIKDTLKEKQWTGINFRGNMVI